jgi:FKBP-type peptidyl-prolyl cis-trans isomerase FklB
MKKICLSISLLALVSFLIVSCGNKNKIDLINQIDSVSYAMGAEMGTNVITQFTNDSIPFSKTFFLQGFKDALDSLDSLIMTRKQRETIMKNFQSVLKKQQDERVLNNKKAGAKFLEENKKQSGVIETQSGLQYKVVREGSGKTPQTTDQVVVHYEGKLINGHIFDSSYERKEFMTFPVNGVIRGWSEALLLMRVGGSYELYIPSDLAYGDQGNQSIAGGSTLIFKVELINIADPAANP